MSKRDCEHEFLPPLDAIAAQPPRAQARALMWTLLAACACALAWASIGEVDVTAVASGRIVPSAHVKRVQARVAGSVAALHVREGDEVAAGTLVVALDAARARADHLRTSSEVLRLAAERARLAALLAPFVDAPAVSPALSPVLDRRVARERAAHVAEQAALEHELARLRAELAADGAELARHAATLPLLSERSSALATLAERALAPRVGWLELEEARLDRVHQRHVLEARRLARAAAIAVAGARLGALEARAETDWRAAFDEVDAALVQARQRQRASAAELAAHFLRAPLDGVIQQLAVHTVGGVVSAGEELMLVVPQQGGLEIEAWVANKDIGFVHVGQAATVKIETFPFTTYGTLAGTLAALAPDAVADDVRGLVFRARVTLSRSAMTLGTRSVPLAPGMAVTVEYALGRRRIIEFLAAPLLRYRAEALRER